MIQFWLKLPSNRYEQLSGNGSHKTTLEIDLALIDIKRIAISNGLNIIVKIITWLIDLRDTIGDWLIQSYGGYKIFISIANQLFIQPG